MDKNSQKRPLFIFVLLLGVIGIVFALNLFQKSSPRSQKPLPTYFNYSEVELNSLRELKSDASMQPEDLWRWEEIAFETVGTTKSDAALASKFYATLVVAQRDAAYLSRNAHGQFMGSLDPTSKEVLCFFFSGACSKIPPGNQDAYSEALAKIVLTKIQQRTEEDRKSTRPYELKPEDEFWAGKAPFKGIDAGSWKPWLVSSVQEFRLLPPLAPDSAETLKQLEAIKLMLPELTDKQKAAIAFWAGGPGTKTPPGMWLKNGTAVMKKADAGLERILFIRSILAMGIADTEIAAMDSKYTYWAKRPFMVDDTIQTFMPTPNHPSYPSDSISIAGFSAAVLSHYFPEEKEKWNVLAEEAGNSRVWSGIHFSGDVEQGLTLGRRIAEAVLSRADRDAV